jgi:hypothetical protein
VVGAVTAYVEPEVTGQGQEPLQGSPVKFGSVLGGMRGDVAEPVRLVAFVHQVPESCGAWFEDG